MIITIIKKLKLKNYFTNGLLVKLF